jgi:hypothetical protein
MPEGGGENRGARNTALDPTIPEKFTTKKLLGSRWAGEKRVQTASDTLMETAP